MCFCISINDQSIDSKPLWCLFLLFFLFSWWCWSIHGQPAYVDKICAQKRKKNKKVFCKRLQNVNNMLFHFDKFYLLRVASIFHGSCPRDWRRFLLLLLFCTQYKTETQQLWAQRFAAKEAFKFQKRKRCRAQQIDCFCSRSYLILHA